MASALNACQHWASSANALWKRHLQHWKTSAEQDFSTGIPVLRKLQHWNKATQHCKTSAEAVLTIDQHWNTSAEGEVFVDLLSRFYNEEILKQQKQLVVDSERHERLLKDVEFSLRHFKGVEAKMSILEEELLEMREDLSSRPGDQQQAGETGHLQPATDELDQEAACEDEPGYESLGCWRDTSASRAIPSLEGIDPRLDGHYSTRHNAFQKCYTVARSMGLKVFALQNGGWCGGSADENVDFRKHGSSTQCYIGGEGGPWSNHVYEIKDITCDN